MKFILMVFKGKFRLFTFIILVGVLTGGVHVGLFIKINEIISGIIKGDKIAAVLFASVFMLLLAYILLNRLLSRKMIDISQKVIHDLRMHLIRSVLKTPYDEIEKKKEILSSAITKDTVSLSQSALSSIYLITSIVTVVGCLVYLAFLSLKVFALILIATILGAAVYIISSNKSQGYLQLARKNEDDLFHHVKEVIDGLREVRINPKKGNDLIEGPLQEASLNNYNYLRRGLFGYFNNGLTGQFLFYLILIIILVFGTTWLHMPASVLVSCVILILYLIGPLESAISLLPSLGAGNVAASRLNELLAWVNQDERTETPAFTGTFEQLLLKDVRFDYSSTELAESKFTLGPIDFELNKGEVAFIYGGNGSGKTTFFHIVLGLIKAGKGKVFLNGEALTGTESIQSLFSPVFSDFHLFDKLYGLSNINHERVQHYLHLFELNDKVFLESAGFSTLNMSTGQRKRLALISMLLEDRPLLFLDEWAADQDPFFREKFYVTILPALKEEGFTILAITHDDKYYHTADTLYKMESGRLLKVHHAQTV